jgi:hypothetical protein
MKLLSVNLARALWFFHLNDLNPRGKSIQRDAFAEMGQRYAFAKFPDAKEILEARQKGAALEFSLGQFKSPSGEIVQLALTIYRDALFADTRSFTADSDAFLTEMLEWLTSEFGLVDHKTLPINKFYVSEIYVSLNKSLNMINPKFSQFAKILGEEIKTPFKNVSFEVGALGFWIDPAIKHVHVPFRLERQEGVGFSEGRYYSMAPLETEEHLKALETLEKLMAG